MKDVDTDTVYIVSTYEYHKHPSAVEPRNNKNSQ